MDETTITKFYTEYLPELVGQVKSADYEEVIRLACDEVKNGERVDEAVDNLVLALIGWLKEHDPLVLKRFYHAKGYIYLPGTVPVSEFKTLADVCLSYLKRWHTEDAMGVPIFLGSILIDLAWTNYVNRL